MPPHFSIRTKTTGVMKFTRWQTLPLSSLQKYIFYLFDPCSTVVKKRKIVLHFHYKVMSRHKTPAPGIVNIQFWQTLTWSTLHYTQFVFSIPWSIQEMTTHQGVITFDGSFTSYHHYVGYFFKEIMHLHAAICPSIRFPAVGVMELTILVDPSLVIIIVHLVCLNHVPETRKRFLVRNTILPTVGSMLVERPKHNNPCIWQRNANYSLSNILSEVRPK